MHGTNMKSEETLNVDGVLDVQYICFGVSLITGIWAVESCGTHFVDF